MCLPSEGLGIPLEKICQSRHAVLASLKGLYDCMIAHDQPVYGRVPESMRKKLLGCRFNSVLSSQSETTDFEEETKGYSFPGKLVYSSSMAGALHLKPSSGSVSQGQWVTQAS